ncbi:flavodoxin family protein [Parabacteroides sp. FAFU027]|uniref:flavodoxin family protein n=1 Tax=Parabacteroides sp. FAFU027 TaxID=2922715 RepID=UPI001FB04780|nr:flavodoxin family protein [Parabacteroides sp. FAFU027]
MAIVSIIYFSGAGHTEKLAEAVGKGAASISGISTNLISIKGDDIVNGRYTNEAVISQLDESDAIIFGAPTYMSGPAAQFKAFADATVGSWFNQKWKDKLAAGFTISGAPSGDKQGTLQFFQSFAMSHSMLWVSLGELPGQPDGVNRLGSWGGAMALASQEPTDVAPNAEDKLTGEKLGARVAGLALKMK